jgi:hypothetical protein
MSKNPNKADFCVFGYQKAEKKLENSHNGTKIREHEIRTYRQNCLFRGK